jgi:hypothetical protein
VTVAQMVQSVSDNCPISINDVAIEQVASDEPDDDLGDGETIGDIAIGADCRSAQLRAERAGNRGSAMMTQQTTAKEGAGSIRTESILFSRLPERSQSLAVHLFPDREKISTIRVDVLITRR